MGLAGGLNVYSYTKSNPITRRDMYGLWPTWQNIYNTFRDPTTTVVTTWYVFGNGGTVFLPDWLSCNDYMTDPLISARVQSQKNAIDRMTEFYAGLLDSGESVFESWGNRSINYVSEHSIFAFGNGYDLVYVECNVTGTGCGGACATSNCRIRASREDTYADPQDLFQHGMVSGSKYSGAANEYGSPFVFGVSCSENYSSVKCL